MRAGAFTLIEVMVVVLIVAAVGALVVPSLVGRLAGTRLEEASRAIGYAGALASAESMRTGEVVLLVAELDPNARGGPEWVLYAEPVGAEGVSGALRSPDGPDEAPPRAPEDVPERLELVSFADVDIRREPDLSALVGPGGGMEPMRGDEEWPGAAAEGEAGRGVVERRRRVLGACFPDGSVRAGPVVYLVPERGGGQLSVRLESMAGRVEVRAVDEEALLLGEEAEAGAPVRPTPAERAGGER